MSPARRPLGLPSTSPYPTSPQEGSPYTHVNTVDAQPTDTAYHASTEPEPVQYPDGWQSQDSQHNYTSYAPDGAMTASLVDTSMTAPPMHYTPQVDSSMDILARKQQEMERKRDLGNAVGLVDEYVKDNLQHLWKPEHQAFWSDLVQQIRAYSDNPH